MKKTLNQANLSSSPSPRTDSHVRCIRILVGLQLVLSIVVGCAPLQSGTDQCPDINVDITSLKDEQHVGMPPEVDTLVAAYLAESGAPPGCAVGIMEDNSVRYLKGYGLADVEHEIPYTHATPAVVGSVSKTWTALAVLKLMEMNLLDLDDTLSDYLTAAPPVWGNITIRELLSHTSGIQRDPVFIGPLSWSGGLSSFLFPGLPQNHFLGIHPRYVYHSYLPAPLVGFEENSSARYSNLGYLLLGAVVDIVVTANGDLVGEDFDQYESFVWRYVGLFDGNLNNSDQMISQCLYEYWRQDDIPNLAHGYTFHDGDYHQPSSSFLASGPRGWEGPAGGWTMTIGDLVRLMMAIQNDDIISATTKTEMMQVVGSDNSGNWGLGVNLIEKLGRDVFMHDGAYPGYKARYTVWPSENFGVAIMSNESNADMRDITDDIAALFIGTEPGADIGPIVGVTAVTFDNATTRTIDPDDTASVFIGTRAGADREPIVGATAVTLDKATTRTIDTNDPGPRADVSEDDVLPTLTDTERQTLVKDLDRETKQQQLIDENRQVRGQFAETMDWLSLIDNTDEDKLEMMKLFSQCADSSQNRTEYYQCVARLSNDLERSGTLTPQQAVTFQQGAVLVDFSEVVVNRTGSRATTQ